MSSHVRTPSPLVPTASRCLRKCGAELARNRRRWVRERAVTLVEVLIAVALIAILSGAMLFGSGALGSSRERAAATLVVSAVRLGLARANTTGRPTRLVFDMDANKLTLEETASLVLAREKNQEVDADEAESDEEKPTDA